MFIGLGRCIHSTFGTNFDVPDFVWIPTYLFEVHGFEMKDLVISGWVPYVGAMIGAIYGGMLARSRIKAGWSVDKTRKFTITLGCLIMLPCLLALAVASTAGVALTLMFLILFGFQIAIGNVQTLPSDFYGGKTVGTLAGFSGMAAKFAGAGIIALVPIMTKGGNYFSIFVLGAVMALTAIAAIWVLCGRIAPLKPGGYRDTV